MDRMRRNLISPTPSWDDDYPPNGEDGWHTKTMHNRPVVARRPLRNIYEPERIVSPPRTLPGGTFQN